MMPSTPPFVLLATGVSSVITGMESFAFINPLSIWSSNQGRPRHCPSSDVVVFDKLPHRRRQHNLQQKSLQQEKNSRGEEFLLLPEMNPNFDSNATSLSGVLYSQVISGIDALYPPYEINLRNARSRTDGYWKYVERGEKPPQELTYGEFDIDFFGILLDISWEHFLEGMDALATTRMTERNVFDCEEQHTPSWRNMTFCDIGSGAGRLVLTAAALHPWKSCRGIEILDGLHNMSVSIANSCRLDAIDRKRLGISGDDNKQYILRIPCKYEVEDLIPSCISERDTMNYLPLAPVEFTCGSFTNPYEYLGDIDCAFVFSSCMKPHIVQELSAAIGRQCKPGTIVVTTEFPLFLNGDIEPLEDDSSMPHGPYEIQLLEKINGWCWLLGGESTAYIHRVKTSLWENYAGPRRKPQNSLEEEAYKLVQLIESGNLTDTNDFLRRVRNAMIFYDLPSEIVPDLE